MPPRTQPPGTGSSPGGGSISTTVRRAALAPVLGSVAGFVDAVGFVSLNVFTAHMSGNSARLGVYLGSSTISNALIVIYAVGLFIVSIAVGTAVMELGSHSDRWSPTAGLLLLEALLLATLAAVGGRDAVGGVLPHEPLGRFYGLLTCAVFAMGLQTSTLQRLSGRTIRTTYVSGMLTTLATEIVAFLLQPRRTAHPGAHSYLADELQVRATAAGRRRMLVISVIWLAYIGGATAGVALHGDWQVYSLAVPSGVLLLLAGMEAVRPSAAAPDLGQQ